MEKKETNPENHTENNQVETENRKEHRNDKIKWGRPMFYLTVALCISSLGLFIWLASRYYQDESQRQQEAFENARREASLASTEVNQSFAELGYLAQKISNDLSDQELPYEDVEERLREDALDNPEILGLGVAFKPGVYGEGLHAPYMIKGGENEFNLIYVEDNYDYTQPPSDNPEAPDTSWYHIPIHEGADWIEPFYGTASEALLAIYSTPFYKIDPDTQEQHVAGVAFVTISLDEVSRQVASLDLGATGYGYAVSKEGKFIAHPNQDLIGNANVVDLAEQSGDSELLADSKIMTQPERFSREAVDPLNGQPAWIFYEPIPATGWTIGVVINSEQTSFEEARREARKAATQISWKFSQISTLPQTIANDISTGTLSYDQVRARIKQDAGSAQGLLGLGAAFAPNIYPAEARLYAPYYIKNKDGKFNWMQVEESYDYTKINSDESDGPDTSWYHRPLNEGSGWNEPFYGTASNELLSTYGAPFYTIEPNTLNQIPAGVIFATITLDEIQNLMSSLDLGKDGYAFVLSPDGMFIAHPDRDLVGRSTLFDLANKAQDEALRADAERITLSKRFSREAVDTLSGKPAWIFYEPILVNGWTIGVVFNKNEYALRTNVAIWQLIYAALSLIAFLFFLSFLVFGFHKGTTWSQWAVSINLSIMLLLMIGLLYYLAGLGEDDQGLRIYSRSSLNKFISMHTAQLQEPDAEPPIYIPTGILIRTVEVPTPPYRIAVSGYLWQKYADDIDKDISQEVVFTQLAGGAPFRMEEIYRRQQNGYETVGWHFTATIRKPFDPTKFPFDRGNVAIRLWHDDFDRNIILVPDVDGYDILNPYMFPGLDGELGVDGWYIHQSFFSYNIHDYNENFGISSFSGNSKSIPELSFNIGLRRNYLDSFVAYVIPLIVAAIMMFALLLMAPSREDPFSNFSYAAALFFVVAVAHSGLRGDVTASGVTYLETFYIMMYIVILLVAMISALIASKINHITIRYRSGLIPQLLYWPVLLGAIALVTMTTLFSAPGPGIY